MDSIWTGMKNSVGLFDYCLQKNLIKRPVFFPYSLILVESEADHDELKPFII